VSAPIALERRIAGLLKDGLWVLLVILMCPVAVLVVGTPVVLLVRLLIEITARL
jgi:hypothetical protein